MKKIDASWGPHHTNSTEALRWWLAYTDAEEMVETYNVREWAETILDGISPVPFTIEGIVNEIQGRCEDEEELEGYLQSLENFYKEE